jgi:hypothetical protein
MFLQLDPVHAVKWKHQNFCLQLTCWFDCVGWKVSSYTGYYLSSYVKIWHLLQRNVCFLNVENNKKIPRAIYLWFQ